MVFKKGSKGEGVKQIQYALGIEADGVFGSQTESAVIFFQTKNGLFPDGVVGKKTLELLNLNFDTDISIIKPIDMILDIDDITEQRRNW